MDPTKRDELHLDGINVHVVSRPSFVLAPISSPEVSPASSVHSQDGRYLE